MGLQSTHQHSHPTKQQNQSQPTLLRTIQDEGFSSRRCSGCHSLRFRCAVEGRQEVLGRPLEGWLEERPRGEVHGRSVRVHFDLQRRRDSRPGCRLNNNFTGGLEGAKGFYEYGINSKEDYICWNIVLENFRGEYQSAADTATHIHEAPKGQAGPPRLAFPNPVPVGDGKKRISIGCMMGPYETGIVSNGQDTAAGFTVKQIEDNPSAFFTDVHSSLAVPGAVRGQLS